jgi:hypothetical protein
MKKNTGFLKGGFKGLVHLRKRPWLIATGLILALSGLAYATYIQSFETDTAGWTGAVMVMTGTHGVPSKTGTFHAEDQNMNGLTYTFWGGSSKTFPPLGYTTSVDIYLDIMAPFMNGTGYANDTRFDWTSAINTPACGHLRDFVFNAGFYTDTDSTGMGPRFVISASNNAGRGNSNPKNPGRMPYTVYDEGWYTFEHRFRDYAGVLAVDLILKDSLGVPLKTWTLSDPTDVITTVGGNRYGWFATEEFPFLAFDNSELIGDQDYCTPPSTPGAKITGGGWIDVLGGKGTFGLTARAANDGTSSGNLSYHGHGIQERTVKSSSITSVSMTGTCVQIFGTATVNGSGSVGFQVQVCDNGEPGTNDTFSISMNDGYIAGGTLRSGNIQIH